MARTPYGSGPNPIQTDRGAEFAALANITRQLQSSMVCSKTSFANLCAAIHLNRQIWNLWAADVSGSENGLSEDLRSKIFYLAEFVNKHSREVLKGTVGAETLVEINLAMMRGLSPMDDA